MVSALEIGGKRGRASHGQAERREENARGGGGRAQKEKGLDTSVLLEPSVSKPPQSVLGPASQDELMMISCSPDPVSFQLHLPQHSVR